MATPYIGEIRMAGFYFNPRQWALCNGQTLLINEHQALYTLIGTNFGGDGTTNFRLPDLRGRAPMMPNMDIGITTGDSIGSETVALQTSDMPTHTHTLSGTAAEATLADPTGALLATYQAASSTDGVNAYSASTNRVGMKTDSITAEGGGQAHNNMQPYTVVNFIIALDGLYPPRN